MFTQLLSGIQHNVVTNAPKVLAFPSKLLPFFIQQKCLSEMLSRVFKEAIEDGDLAFLQDKWLKVSITDLDLVWFLTFENEAIVIKENAAVTDVSFSAEVNELILVAGRKEDPDTLFFQRRLSIEGDTELGLEVKNLLDNIEFDNLPPLAQKAISHFSNFIKTGLAVKSTESSITHKASV
ncbi:SCP2 sterol-binding domain-containing protein [Psychromonas sp.]|nr:SCP2 sterol-binding domain-containing protein [Psychromonas sp.]